MVTHRLALLALLLIGCGEEDPSVPGRCSDRSGSYRIRYTERAGGTCGSQPDQTIVIGEEKPAEGCTVEGPKVSADQCTVQVSSSCAEPTLGPEAISETVGSATWAMDGASAKATIDIVAREGKDGKILCKSSYDATYSRLLASWDTTGGWACMV